MATFCTPRALNVLPLAKCRVVEKAEAAWSLLCLLSLVGQTAERVKQPRMCAFSFKLPYLLLRCIEGSLGTFLSTAMNILTFSLAALRGFGDLGRGGRSLAGRDILGETRGRSVGVITIHDRVKESARLVGTSSLAYHSEKTVEMEGGGRRRLKLGCIGTTIAWFL